MATGTHKEDSMTQGIAKGANIVINGTKKFTVTKIGGFSMDLVGPRGGRMSIIQNIHNASVWFLVNYRGSERVTSIEVL